MDYKLICLDMDGTLLNDEKKISDENIEAIKKANERGVKVTISTGRLHTSAKYYADLLNVKVPVISSNGAYIREKDKGEAVYKNQLGYENCKKVLNVIEEYKFEAYFHCAEEIISSNPVSKDYMYYRLNKDLPQDMKIKFTITSEIEKTLKKKSEEVLKCILFCKNTDVLDEAKRKLSQFDELEITTSGINNIEVNSKGVCKGKAVKMLSEFYNINTEEIICIGDSYNDLSMIKCAGLGIAMGNSSDYIKQEAQYITDDNNNNGVAKAIEKFVL